MTSYRFRPGWVATIAALVVFPVLISLGFWQLDRAREKIQLRDRYQSRGEMASLNINAGPVDRNSDEYRPATAVGRYLPEFTIYLDNKVLDGVPGYEILTPLALEGDPGATDRHMLVNRGWVSWGETREVLPEIDTPRGSVEVIGRLRAPAEYFTLEDPERENGFEPLWQNLDLERFESVTGLRVSPLVMAQDPSSELDPGLKRRQPQYDDPWVHRHRAYATQWFGLAFVLLVLYVVLNLERRNREQE